jgi:hypothetical protein
MILTCLSPTPLAGNCTRRDTRQPPYPRDEWIWDKQL